MKTVKEQEEVLQLTEEEKLSLTTGKGCWNTHPVERADIYSVTFSDGPVGLRKEKDGQTLPAVCFPSISKLACSFDPAVLREVGAAIGEQCRSEGVDVLLAPAINIKRSPRGGRNFEYFSEDPFLTAELANAYIKGVNSQEVGVCVKHFAANSQEYGRRVCDSVVDERALREIYLSAFEKVVKASKPCSVMCAYNKLNGEYCSQNKTLLTDILRNEWGFDGVVLSDWGATDDRSKGIEAGLDLQMPEGDLAPVKAALANGELPNEALDKCADRVVKLSERFKENNVRNADYNYQHNLVRKISADCTVLAKNNCKILPFSQKDKIALIGELCEFPYFQGGGSSCVNAYKTESLKETFDKSSVSFTYAKGYSLQNSDDATRLLEQARNVASECDKVLLIVGANGSEGEGADRQSWKLPQNQLEVIDAVTSANSNVVIVVQSGAPVDVSWHHGAKALILDYLGGENGGSLFDVVYGIISPTGRLAETWPLELPDFDADFSSNYKRQLYRESIFVGYRYYTTANVSVAFPFGYGLNYNQITWKKVQLVNDTVSPLGKVEITLDLQNKGATDDAETVEVFVSNLDGRQFCAKKNLVGFKKVRLKSGEKKTVSLKIDAADFASYDTEKKEFCVNGGRYLLTVAKNANDYGYPLEVTVAGENTTKDSSETLFRYYNLDETFNPTDEEFAALFGKEFPQETTTPFTVNSPLCETADTFVGKRLIKLWTKSGDKRTLLALPLVDFVGMRQNLSREMLETIVDMLNGKVRENLFKLWKQYRKHKSMLKKKK